MPKYLYLWRLNFSQVRLDSVEMGKLQERLFAVIEENLKKGGLKDWGMYLDGVHGFAIRECEGTELMTGIMSFAPYIEVLAVHEVLILDKARKIYAGVVQSRMEATMKL